MNLTQSDRDWMLENYPDLKFEIKEGKEYITGTLFFDMVYYNEDKSRVIKPETKHLTHGERIEDKYEIEILLENDPRSILPKVREIGERISKSGKSHGRTPLGMHLYDSGSCCLSLDQEESRLLDKGFNLPDFFHNVLIPYFYSQSYFEKHGFWKWGERTHFFPAYFEWYAEQSTTNKSTALEVISRLKSREYLGPTKALLEETNHNFERMPCLCGNPTGKMIKNCHPNIAAGFFRFREDIERYGIIV